MMLMYPSTWKFDDYEARQAWLPDKHIFYKQRVIDISDGAKKWEGMDEKSESMDEEHHHGQRGIAGAGSKTAKS